MPSRLGFHYSKSIVCSVEAVIVYTTSYIIALSRGDRTNRTRTLRKLRLKQASATRFLSSLIAVYSAILAGFTGFTYFFAFGGVGVGPLIGMWSCAAVGLVLAFYGRKIVQKDNGSFMVATQQRPIYLFLTLGLLVAALVTSGFCLIYAEQGVTIIRSNWNKIKTGVLPFTSEYDLQLTVTQNLEVLAGLGFGFAGILVDHGHAFQAALRPGPRYRCGPPGPEFRHPRARFLRGVACH